MDEFIYKDYASWKLENVEMLQKFQQNHNVIFERLEPVYAVVEYIYDMVCEKQTMDEDLETIFEVGFNYLHAQIEVIKIYFESLFKSDCDDFEDYAEMLLFLLYIYDIRNDLENHGFDSGIEELSNAETYIENVIMERRNESEYVRNLMGEALKKVEETIDYDYVSIIDIYVEIAENLGIFLYEEDEFVI
jgi:hypothetical protein